MIPIQPSQFYEAIQHDLSPSVLEQFKDYIDSKRSSQSVSFVNIFEDLSIMEKSLSSLTVEMVPSWVIHSEAGLCYNLTFNCTTTIKEWQICDIISVLSFLLYKNAGNYMFDYNTNIIKQLFYPIPQTGNKKWEGDELDMRIKFAHWLSQQTKSYLLMFTPKSTI